MRKLFAMIVSVVLAIGVYAPAYADAQTGSITIENAVVGQTYKAYQILDLESYDAASDAYSYKASAAWSDFINGNDVKGVYVDVNDQGYVTWREKNLTCIDTSHEHVDTCYTKTDIAKFAKLAQAYAEANSIAESGSAKAVSNVEGVTVTTVVISGLDLGYYLVGTTLGTICSLDTTNPDVEMEEKNSVPSAVKKVEEDSDGAWGDSNDADTNQVVNFEVTVTVQSGAENYILHDVMSAGLTYTGVTGVTIEGVAVDATNYTVTAGTCTDGCTFEVAFDDNYVASLTAGTQIVVAYSATLNENAVVGLPGNPNEVKLQYGDDAAPSYTPEAGTITYTWDAKVVKFAKKDGVEIRLADAIFKLCYDEAGQNALKFHSLGNNAYEVCAGTVCADAHVDSITTDATGVFAIEGLDKGTYYLVETDAPAGYNKLDGSVKVEVVGAAEDEGSVLTYTTVETKVENKTGTELPSTGGMGTKLFYLVGAALIIGAAVTLIARRRAEGIEE